MHEATKSTPTIFLVEEDNLARRSFTRSLRDLGYSVLVSADLEDAFEWTSGNGYIHADLVLVDLLGKLPGEALTIGRRLREHCKYDGHTPLIIISPFCDLRNPDLTTRVSTWLVRNRCSKMLTTLIGCHSIRPLDRLSGTGWTVFTKCKGQPRERPLLFSTHNQLDAIQV